MWTNQRRVRAAAFAIGCTATIASSSVWAHPHNVKGQPIANGQNHPAFINGQSCESFGPASTTPIGPAWYGLETAHHGPDAGTRGRADGCYETTGRVPPGQDVQSPVIR